MLVVQLQCIHSLRAKSNAIQDMYIVQLYTE